MKPVELHHGAATDVGHVREVNEDAFLAAPPVFVVADGMGGHEGGDVASRIVVEEFARLAERGLRPATRCRAGRRHPARSPAPGSPSTATGSAPQRPRACTPAPPPWSPLLVDDDGTPSGCWPTSATPASTASPTASSSRSASTTASSRSSSTPGRSPPRRPSIHPERHVITRALGGPEGVRRRLLPAAAARGRAAAAVHRRDHRDDRRRRHRRHPRLAAADPRDAADRLVAAALDAGGRDNATAVVVDVVGLVHDDSLRLRAAARESRSRSWEPCP